MFSFPLRRPAVAIACAAALVTSAACGNDPTRAAPVDVDKIIWSLRSAPRGAVVLAVGDTIQLDVHAINIDQTPVPIDRGTIIYSTANPSYVTVSPTGLVRAVMATPPSTRIAIVASYMADNIVRADTAIVAVTPTRLTIDSITFTVDSARVPFWRAFFPNPMAWGGGVPLPDVYIGFRARDPSVWANPVQGYATFYVAGQQWLYASTNAYGQTYSDSLLVTVLSWASQSLSVSSDATGNILASGANVDTYIQPCGTISWTNRTSVLVDITFDKPEQVGTCGVDDTTPTGNITNLAPNTAVTRKFPGVRTTTWTVSRTSAPGDALASGAIVTK
jgi:hypothetical protein